MMQKILMLWTLTFGLFLSLFAEGQEIVFEKIREDIQYSKVFPTWIQVCVGTRYMPRNAPPGNSGGHSNMFIQGACIDKVGSYPKLKKCDTEPTELAGVGVSVNKSWTNANWTAIPGVERFLLGGYKGDKLLTKDVFLDLIRENAELFSRNKLNPDKRAVTYGRNYLGPEKSDYEAVIANSIGTDFGMSLARDLYCVRTPITEEILEKAIDYLNSLNDFAFAEGYRWDLFTNNCVMPVNNTLATIGIMDIVRPTEATMVKKLKLVGIGLAENLFGATPPISFPANLLVDMITLAFEAPIEHREELQENVRLKGSLEKLGWLPTAHGAILRHYPMVSSKLNGMFRLGGMPSIWLPGSFSRVVGKSLMKLSLDPEALPRLDESPEFLQIIKHPEINMDLEGNIRFFIKRYQGILKGSTSELLSGAPRRGGFNQKYYDYFLKQLEDASSRLDRLVLEKAAPN